MKSIVFLLTLFLISVSISSPAQAQDFGYGVPINGTINDATPSTTYRFTGLRGDVIAIDLTVTSGDLDPMILLMDSKGALIALSDDAALPGRGSRDLHLDSLHIPRSDQYSLVVARFGYSLGTTSGAYTLGVDRIGVSSASGSALRYGDSVYNTITDSTPQVYYSFRAARGDVITVRMQRASGDLDPALELVNSQSQIIDQNDDAPGTLDAAINGFVIRESGVYVIIASRFGEAAGRSKGSFVLTLAAGAQSGLGRTVNLALPILPGVPVQGEISNDSSVQFYSFEGKRDDVVTIRMVRPSGDLDSFLALLDPSQREITNDDDSGGGQNALIDHFVLPADGTYTIVATRYNRAQGDTTGPYLLQLDAGGNISTSIPQSVPRIEVGTPVEGIINDSAPQVIYVFVGQKGESLTITLNRTSGNLDARLIILDLNQHPLSTDDDSGGHQNAKIDPFIVPATGIYYVVATRYNGTQGNANTSGGYTLTLAPAQPTS